LHLAITPDHFRVPSPQGTLTVDGVIVSDFKVGERTAATTVFQAMDEGGDGVGPGYAGILGENYLDNFDVEIDPGLGRVNLLAPSECPGASAYWAPEHFELPIFLGANHRPRVHIAIDGKALDAYLDTSKAHSVIDFAAWAWRSMSP
jgi:hypothetical protein